MALPEGAPSPRLCTLIKTSPTQEYGYNLHAEKTRGQFVGIVDPGSVADLGGLRTGDRIYAINGQSVAGETHKKLVQKIKANPMRCEMLVVSEADAEWYKERNIEIHLGLPNIIRLPRENQSAEPSRRTTGASSVRATPAQSVKADPVFVAPPPPPSADMNRPLPTICVLEKSTPNDEFGFNLHAERNKGHFIGAVDAGSIGDRAGLKMGQRIVGVNETLIYPTTPRKDVVALIKRNPMNTRLLVASEDVDHWYRDNNEEYSFQHAKMAHEEVQALSPHSIQISDEEEVHISSPSPKEHEEPVQVEEPVQAEAPAPVHYDETPAVYNPYDEPPTEAMMQYDVVPSENLLDAVFSGTSAPETAAVFNPPVEELVYIPEPVEQQHLVDHEGHSKAPSVVSVASSPAPAEVYEQELYDPYLSMPPPLPVETKEVYGNGHVNGFNNNGYSSYNHSPSSYEYDDIYGLSAKEARARLRHEKPKAAPMSLEEKYRLVSNM